MSLHRNTVYRLVNMLVRATDSISIDPSQYPGNIVVMTWKITWEGGEPTLMYQGLGEGLVAAPDAENEEYRAWRFDKRRIGTLNAPFTEPFPMGFVDLTFFCGAFFGGGDAKPGKVRIGVAKMPSETEWELSLYLGEGVAIVRAPLPGYDPNDETVPVIPPSEA